LSAGTPPQTPLGELKALPQIPWLDFRGPTSNGKGKGREGKEGRVRAGREKEGRRGKRRARSRGEGIGR